MVRQAARDAITVLSFSILPMVGFPGCAVRPLLFLPLAEQLRDARVVLGEVVVDAQEREVLPLVNAAQRASHLGVVQQTLENGWGTTCRCVRIVQRGKGTMTRRGTYRSRNGIAAKP